MRRCGAEREKQRHYRADHRLLQPPHVQDPLPPLRRFITQPQPYDSESPEAICEERERETSAPVPVCSFTRWRGFFSLSILLSSKTSKLCPSHSVSASNHSFPNFLPRPLLSPPMMRLSKLRCLTMPP